MIAEKDGLYRGPWKRVALRKEVAGLWSVVHAIALTGYGPQALKALGLKRTSSAALPMADAMEAAAEVDAALVALEKPVSAPAEALPPPTKEELAEQAAKAKAKKKTAKLKQGGLW